MCSEQTAQRPDGPEVTAAGPEEQLVPSLNREPVGPLVEAARLGDQAAWTEIVLRFAPLLQSVLRGFRFDPDEARDVAQVVWLRLVEQLGNLREPNALAGWLSTTTRNECIQRQRKQARLPIDHGTVEVASRNEGPDEVAVGNSERAHMRACFGRLDERCQRLLGLLISDVPGGYTAIAELLNMPMGSIGPTRARCLESLRSLYEGTAKQ